MDEVTRLGLVVTEAGADPEHLAELTVWLRQELAELPTLRQRGRCTTPRPTRPGWPSTSGSRTAAPAT